MAPTARSLRCPTGVQEIISLFSHSLLSTHPDCWATHWSKEDLDDCKEDCDDLSVVLYEEITSTLISKEILSILVSNHCYSWEARLPLPQSNMEQLFGQKIPESIKSLSHTRKRKCLLNFSCDSWKAFFQVMKLI